MARLEFRLPDIGEGVAEAEVVEWTAQLGDAVKEGQAVVAVMTDKATVELEAPADGILLERHGKPGELLAVGAVLFALETAAPGGAGPEPVQAPVGGADEASPDAAAPEPAPEPVQAPVQAPVPSGREPVSPPASRSSGRVLAAPAVRQRARTLGIDLASVPAAAGPVSHADLDRHLLAQAPRLPADRRDVGVPGTAGTELPLTGLRRQIARRMQDAHRIPHFTYVEELDVTALEGRRAELDGQRGERAPLHLLPFLVMAMCRALRQFPSLNAHYDDTREVLVRYDAVHVGIATQTDDGLLVPVLRDAQDRDLWDIAREIAALAGAARAGKLAREQLHGSTITLTSLGKLGGIAATPIINRPEVAILAPHRVIERPVLREGRIEPRQIMNLSVSCDHRVIDGYVAASFVRAIREAIEEPEF